LIKTVCFFRSREAKIQFTSQELAHLLHFLYITYYAIFAYFFTNR